MWFSLALFVTLISAYKPPSVDNNTFTRELLNVLDNATRHSENILCVGDLNCDILHPTNGDKPWDSIFPFPTEPPFYVITQATRWSSRSQSEEYFHFSVI